MVDNMIIHNCIKCDGLCDCECIYDDECDGCRDCNLEKALRNDVWNDDYEYDEYYDTDEW